MQAFCVRGVQRNALTREQYTNISSNEAQLMRDH